MACSLCYWYWLLMEVLCLFVKLGDYFDYVFLNVILVFLYNFHVKLSFSEKFSCIPVCCSRQLEHNRSLIVVKVTFFNVVVLAAFLKPCYSNNNMIHRVHDVIYQKVHEMTGTTTAYKIVTVCCFFLLLTVLHTFFSFCFLCHWQNFSHYNCTLILLRNSFYSWC